MSWYPVFAAIAIVLAAIFGVDHPSRTILLQVIIAAATFIALGLESWKMSKSSTDVVRFR